LRVKVRLFAIVREKAGRGEIDIELDSGATVINAKQHLQRALNLGMLLERVAWAVNREYVGIDHVLCDGDEVAVIPAVSGG
jgi:molybdopterin converting factor subunit 1